MARRTFAEAATVNDQAAEIIAGIINEAATAPEVEQQATGETAAGLATVDAATNTGLATSLRGAANLLEQGAEEWARREYPNATPIQHMALVQVEALRQVSSFDLMATLLRAHYLRRIHENGLLEAHPGHYESLRQMAEENGMVVSEISFVLDFANVLIPYVQNELQIPIAEFWAALGKSKIKEMMAPLKALISGDNPDAQTTRAAVERLITDALAGIETNPTPEEAEVVAQAADTTQPEEVRQEAHEQIIRHARRRAARHLIETAQNLPVNGEGGLREFLRPAEVERIQMALVNGADGEQYILAKLTPEQATLVSRRLRDHLTILPVELPPDVRQQQTALFRVGPIRSFYERFFGNRGRR